MTDSIWAAMFAASIHFPRQGTDYFAQSQPPSRRSFEHPIHRARWSTAERDGWVVLPLTKSACTPENWTGHGKTECHDWYVWAVAQARALRLDVMLMTVSSKHFANRQPEVLEPPS